MPQTWMISIDEAPGQAHATFDPANLNIVDGDVVFWRNNTSRPHQPKPVGGDDDAWVEEIPGKLPDQPAPTSRQVSFALERDQNGNLIQQSATFYYVCAFDADETGTINVTAAT